MVTLDFLSVCHGIFIGGFMIGVYLMLLYAKTDDAPLVKPIQDILKFLILPFGVVCIVGDVVMLISDYMY
jgi:NhaP-type Na+/H+ or K+/H+ antiporter